MSTATVTVPQPGKVYTVDKSTTVSRDVRRIFVTAVEVYSHTWIVRGYRVSDTSAYELTGEAVTESGDIGTRYGVPHEAFCAPLGLGPERGREQKPLFSGRFPASDASRVAAAEAEGRKRQMDEWAAQDERHQAERDDLIRAARAAGVNVRQIALRMGISRTTVYAVLGADAGDE